MIEKRNFYGGLDSDSDLRAISPGDYRAAINCRTGITDQGSTFSIENTKGNTLINYTLPLGSNTCIGSRNFDVQSIVIYFLYNDIGLHSILQYSWATNAITLILQDSSLNFDINHKITGINLVDNLLFWTDDFSTPKKINIQTAVSGGYAPFNIDYAEALKAPPLYPPTPVYFTDITKNANYLNGFLFQFKYRYYYDDFEKSAFSPISIVALPALDASTFTDTLKNNRIDIGITTGSKIVNKIEIAARIGNTGDFFSIIVLDKRDSYNIIADDSPYTFLFYNDGVYNSVNLPESVKLFDSVPKLAKAQDVIYPTKIAYGNVLDGFDPVSTVMKLDLTVEPEAATKTYNIICPKIFIKSPFSLYNDMTSSPELIAQPIVYFNGTLSPSFGGFAPNPANPTVDWDCLYPQNYFQEIPLGGFVFYLAGTNYYGISKQVAITNFGPGPYNIPFVAGPLPQPLAVNDIGANLYQQKVYSSVTIPNVQEGEYLLRIADHGTTQSEIDAGDLAYQKRSTNTVQVAGVQYFEVEIIISGGVATLNGSPIAIVGNTITLPDSMILDLTNANQGQFTNVISGYCIDHDTVLPTFPTKAQMLAETRIDLAKLYFQSSTGNFPVQPVAAFLTGITSTWYGLTPTTFTDHNGYFFFAGGFTTATPAALVSVSNVQSGSTGGGAGTFYNYGGSGYTPTAGVIENRAFIRTPSAGYFDNSRTTISGTMLDSVGFIKGASVVIGRGNWGSTDASGHFRIVVYADTHAGFTRSDKIYYEVLGVVIATFVPGNDLFNIGFGFTTTPQTNHASPYNQPSPYNYQFGLTTVNVIVSIIGKNATDSNFKRGGWYQYGIVYYNKGNQSGVTNTNDYASLSTSFTGKTNLYGNKIYVPFYTELNPSTGSIYGGSKVDISWSIYHEPPAWADHYQIVRTKNSANNRFLQFLAKSIAYVDDNNAVTTFLLGTKIRMDITNIVSDFTVIFPNSTLVYDWIKTPSDDRVRFIRDNNGNFFNQYMDVEVLGYDSSTYLYLENKPGMVDFTGMNGLLFEVYNPKLQLAADEQLFWEIGECYPIGTTAGIKYHKGPTQDQSASYPNLFNNIPISVIPATGTFIGGDTYYHLRLMPFSGGTKTYFIESSAVSDFYRSEVSDIGRPNKLDPDFREVRRATTIFYSEAYIPETNINSLNSFYDTNFESYEQKYGSIQKLYAENHRLLSFQELKIGQIPVSQQVIYSNSGQPLSTDSSIVLGTIIYYDGEFGIGKNPESFAQFGSAKYFTDTNRLVPLRLSNDGLTVISENDRRTIKMHTYFTNKLTQYNKTPNAFICGAFDKQFKNYILCFSPISSLGETIVWDELSNRWKTNFNFIPDSICQTNEGIVSWHNGALYTHNTNPVYNNFYGVQYDSEISVPANQEPSNVKVMQALSEETPDIWEADITTGNGQFTQVIAQDFSLRENMQYAEVQRDYNTPNVVDPSVNGDMMRDTSFLIKLKSTLTTFTKLFAINIIYSHSERSNK